MGTEQKKAFLAILLSGIVLFAWQAWFAPSPPVVVPEKKEKSFTREAPLHSSKRKEESQKTKLNQKKEIVSLTNEQDIFVISNLLTIEDIKTASAVSPFHEIVGDNVPISIELLTDNGYHPLNFNFNQLRGKNYLSGKDPRYKIDLTARLDPSGKFALSLTSPYKYRYRITLHSEPKELGNRMREFLAFKGSDVERIRVGDEQFESATFKWFGLDFNYHLLAFVPEKAEHMKYKSTTSGKMIVDLLNPSNSYKGFFIFSKKNYDDLTALGENLNLSVDFGFFGIIAVPMLRGLQFFYRYVANYGLAIILLTLVIRLITFPLQYKSFKSMKKMQEVQPELVKIKEKYKDDPRKMQVETMELFKRVGANPLGGCFPLLLQMPVFFAFYQVLYNAVELVHAPFYFWITDLSAKDPYYVLPILMTITMFLQTKLNPTTITDPTQKKIMYFMPLIFGFIMKDLPSGLNLYMTVSILFGIAQQLMVYKTMSD